jgi:hypothetical protein
MTDGRANTNDCRKDFITAIVTGLIGKQKMGKIFIMMIKNNLC